jgi:hypothetical protein
LKEGGKEEGETAAVTTDAAAAAAAPADSAPTNVPGQVAPLTDTTSEALTAEKGTEDAEKAKNRATRERKQRGPPEDGVPSKTKVMVANLPYDLTEEKVPFFSFLKKISS